MHLPAMNGKPERFSKLTLQLYLNEGFEGGSTTFMQDSREEVRVECVPKTGMALVFSQDLYHEGSTLVKGRKYAVRTDFMYTNK